jgi:hypothetical protein
MSKAMRFSAWPTEGAKTSSRKATANRTVRHQHL